MHRALEEADRVEGRQRDPDDGYEGIDDLRLEDPDQDVELPDEVGRPRHRQGRQRDDEEQGREHRRSHRETSEPGKVLAPGALPQQGDDEEDRCHHEAVVDHLEHRAVSAVGAQGEDPDRDEAELGDRGVAGDQAHVGLRERHHRPVEDAGDADQQDQLLVLHGGLGVEGQRDAQEAVGANLREHPGEQRQHRQRRRPVGVGQPAVDDYRRHLDQEGGGEEQEDPFLASGRERMGAQVGNREAQLPDLVGGENRGGDRGHQHQQRSDQRVDDHLGGRRDAVLASEGADQEPERHQHEVEEEDEQQQVLGQEGAHGGGLAEPQHEEVDPAAIGHPEAREDGHPRPQERRQQDQEEADPVDAELVADAEVRDPALRDGVLKACFGGLEAGHQGDREPEHEPRAEDRRDCHGPSRHHEAEQPHRQRQPEDHLDHEAPPVLTCHLWL